jgi:hypothetical protein
VSTPHRPQERALYGVLVMMFFTIGTNIHFDPQLVALIVPAVEH